MPYGTVTTSVFERTLEPAMSPSGESFFQWNYAAIGLVAAALLLTFMTTATAAWTFERDKPPVRAISATERMKIVRSTLYVAAAVSVAAMIAVETEFTAAAGLFREGTADDPSPVRALIENIGSAIVFALGIALGLALAAAYVPAALYLYPAYNAAKAAEKEASGFWSFLSGEQLGIILRFLAIIAPVIAGTVAGIFGQELSPTQ
jgi:hypothetical protein